MNENPMFSVIVPVYNTEKELSRCVDSILGQSFDDYELILVDDGSKDQSGQIIDEYGRTDEHVVAIHQENMGCAEARNTGIRASKGQYLMFVDSDDRWNDPNALEKLCEIVVSSSPDLICFGVKIVDESGKEVKVRRPSLPDGISNDKYSIFRYLVQHNEYFSTSYVKIIKREFFIENNMFFVKGLLSEDIEWSARLMMFCKDVKVFPEAFYERIRRSEGAITSSIGRKNIDHILMQIENGILDAAKHAENHDFYEVYMEYWAYQYAMLLGLVSKLKDEPDYENYIERLSKCRQLLRYDHVKKVKAVRTTVSILGIKNTASVLGKLYQKKYE